MLFKTPVEWAGWDAISRNCCWLRHQQSSNGGVSVEVESSSLLLKSGPWGNGGRVFASWLSY